jgi:excisionase family DNA binding protein
VVSRIISNRTIREATAHGPPLGHEEFLPEIEHDFRIQPQRGKTRQPRKPRATVNAISLMSRPEVGLFHADWLLPKPFRLQLLLAIASIVCWCRFRTEGVGKMAQGTLAPKLPSEAEAILAKESSRVLASRVQTAEPLRLRMLDDPAKGTVKIPASAVRMLVHILEEMARGNAVTLIPVHAELTTQEAADMLNISRPSLIQILDQGKIEFRRVGTHRRVRFEGLMAYKRRADADRRAALAELAAYDQELGI